MVRWVTALALLWATGAGAADIYGRVSVIDGDTFRVNGVSVRLHGIDAPETWQTCQTEHGVSFSCGGWVTDTVSAQYEGAHARCDVLEIDRYGRPVARCRVQGADVGHALVLQGLAFAFLTYSDDYEQVAETAAAADAGLNSMLVQSPAWVRKTRAIGRIPEDRACGIKGNISTSGAHIYHVPGQRFYEATGIRPERGERWFCSEEEAVAAGWRKSRR